MSTSAVIDTSVEILELIQALLEDEGYTVATAYIVDFKRNTADLDAFFQTHQPQAVVYDIAIPYEENWAFFREYVLAASHLPNTILC